MGLGSCRGLGVGFAAVGSFIDGLLIIRCTRYLACAVVLALCYALGTSHSRVHFWHVASEFRFCRLYPHFACARRISILRLCVALAYLPLHGALAFCMLWTHARALRLHVCSCVARFACHVCLFSFARGAYVSRLCVVPALRIFASDHASRPHVARSDACNFTPLLVRATPRRL